MSKLFTIFILILLNLPIVFAQSTVDTVQLASVLQLWRSKDPIKISTLDSIRSSIEIVNNNVDELLFIAFQKATKGQQFNFSNRETMNGYFTEAELLLHSSQFLSTDCTLYEAMGNHLLSLLADSLTTAIKIKLVDPESMEIHYIRQRLADNHILIDIKPSNEAKTWEYLKQGRFGYVFHKLTTTYIMEFSLFLFCAVTCIILFFFLLKKIKRGKEIANNEPIEEVKEPSKVMSLRNVIPSALILIVSSFLVAQRSCAQSPKILDCELLKLETGIDEAERLTRFKLETLTDTTTSGALDTQNQLFSSVWTSIQRPSFLLGNTMDCSLLMQDTEYLNRLNAAYKKAEDLLLAVNEKRISTSNADTAQFKLILPAKRALSSTENHTSRQQSSNEESNTGFVRQSDCLRYTVGTKEYACFVVNPRSETMKIDFLWKDDKGQILGSYARAMEYLKQHKRNPVMLMNAGIFTDELAPLGMYYSNGKKLQKFNTGEGNGNFYLNPAGVFILEKSGIAKIKTRAEFLSELADTAKIKHATQSGPMLVINGEIHPIFKKNSTNFNIRNGVGVMPDGNIVFVISEEPVTLYEFAEVFKERFKCKDALYLDGAISKAYIPKLNKKESSGQFAGIISISY